MPLYARSEIPEVWLVDVARDLVEVYAQPVSGRYQDFRETRRGETLTLSSLLNHDQRGRHSRLSPRTRFHARKDSG
ncbi:MAG: Uma2 family endonuclease [Blastocatellia bacterium]